MRTGSNLMRRGATYYARQIVPVELQHLMGKRELIRSLNTSDVRTATARKLAVLSEWQHQLTIFAVAVTSPKPTSRMPLGSTTPPSFG